MLTPDDRVRIKAKDIFNHPWIKKYEKRVSDMIAKNESIMSIKVDNEKDQVFRKDESKPKMPIQPKLIDPPKLEKKESKSENKIIISNKVDENIKPNFAKDIPPKNNSNKNVIVISNKIERKESNLDEKEQERLNLIKNINQKKETSINEAINTSVNDFSLLNINSKSDSLFDKVLSKVKERNLGKLY